MTVKLYTVRIEREFVFASDAATMHEVEEEVRTAIVRGHIDDDCFEDAAEVRSMSFLPGGYGKDCIPYGKQTDDKTIGEYIEEGAAPEFVKAQADLEAKMTSHGYTRTPDGGWTKPAPKVPE